MDRVRVRVMVGVIVRVTVMVMVRDTPWSTGCGKDRALVFVPLALVVVLVGPEVR